MIITTANEFVGKIHDRMPALLTPYQFDSWLSGGAGPGVAQALGSEVTADVSGVAEGEQFEGGGRRSDVD
jgi:putative SOS response-associated peptidase YedK